MNIKYLRYEYKFQKLSSNMLVKYAFQLIIVKIIIDLYKNSEKKLRT